MLGERLPSDRRTGFDEIVEGELHPSHDPDASFGSVTEVLERAG